MAALGDADLIVRVRIGDQDAAAELYSRHESAARALARSMARWGDVDDLVAEAFERVLRALHSGGGPENAFRPYLLTTLRRVAYDRTAATRRTEPVAEVPQYETDPEFVDPAVAGLERTMVAKAFATLPARWRMVLWHTEVEGMTATELAPLLGVTPNAVAALAYRARESLREAYLVAHSSSDQPRECRGVLARLGAYVRESAGVRDRAKVQRHLAECPRCAELCDEMRDVNHGMRVIIAPLVLGVLAEEYRRPILIVGSTVAGIGAGAAGGATALATAATGGRVAGKARRLMHLRNAAAASSSGGSWVGAVTAAAVVAAIAITAGTVVVVRTSGGGDDTAAAVTTVALNPPSPTTALESTSSGPPTLEPPAPDTTAGATTEAPSTVAEPPFARPAVFQPAAAANVSAPATTEPATTDAATTELSTTQPATTSPPTTLATTSPANGPASTVGVVTTPRNTASSPVQQSNTSQPVATTPAPGTTRTATTPPPTTVKPTTTTAKPTTTTMKPTTTTAKPTTTTAHVVTAGLSIALGSAGNLVGGQRASFSAVVGNAGPDTAGPITVSIRGSGGVRAVTPGATNFSRPLNGSGGSWSCAGDGSGAGLTCQTSSLAAGAKSTIAFDVIADPNAGKDAALDLTVSAPGADPNPNDNHVRIGVAVTPPKLGADVSISAFQESWFHDHVVKVDVTVANAGPGTASDVTLTASLPPGLTFVEADGAWCKPSGGVTLGPSLTCSLGDLAPGAQAHLLLLALLPYPGQSSLSLSAGSSTTDPQPANNSVTITLHRSDRN